jgi:hypothetical protein
MVAGLSEGVVTAGHHGWIDFGGFTISEAIAMRSWWVCLLQQVYAAIAADFICCLGRHVSSRYPTSAKLSGCVRARNAESLRNITCTATTAVLVGIIAFASWGPLGFLSISFLSRSSWLLPGAAVYRSTQLSGSLESWLHGHFLDRMLDLAHISVPPTFSIGAQVGMSFSW